MKDNKRRLFEMMGLVDSSFYYDYENGNPEFHTDINEDNNTKYLTVYHGTQPKFVAGIQADGLKDKTGYNQGWYMVSTDFDSALFHSNPDDNKDYVYVFEFKIPYIKSDRWTGYPYLWKGEKLNDNSMWFALMQQLPANFIVKLHKVPFEKWFEQKQKGF